MSEADQKLEDEVLLRMLATPPTPHKPLREKGRAEARPNRSRKKDGE